MTMQRREQEAESRRRLRRGVGASLLLHLIVFGGGGSWLLREQAGRPADPVPLAARLAVLPVSPAASAALPPAPPVRAPAPAANSAERRIPPPAIPATSPAAMPAPLAAPVATPPEATPVRAALPAERPDAGTRAGPAAGGGERPATASSAAPASAGATAQAAAAGDGLDADALRGYRMALALQARRVKRYPPQAMAAGWQGTAEVRIAVGPGGRAQGAELARSSGHELLDRAALGMVESALQRAAVPAALQAHAFAVVLPVVFSLEER